MNLRVVLRNFSLSTKRLGELREVASLLEEIVRKFGSLHQVRWMASKQRALNVTIITGSQLFHTYKILLLE